MIDRLLQDRRVYLLLAAYFLLNIVVRLSLPDSLELDEGQQLFLAQWLAPGYDSQPPFYNWLQYGVVRLFGDTIFSLTVLKNGLLFACFLMFGMTAHMLIGDRRLAAVATLGLITIPQISFEAERDLSHTVAVLFAACLFLYAFLGTLRQPAAWSYALTGVAVGIGLLSKYNFAFLPLAAVLALLPEAAYRRRLLDTRMILTVVIAAAIVMPHGLWFLEHVGTATARTLGKLTEGHEPARAGQILRGLGSLFGAMAMFVLPTLAFFGIAFGRTLWDARYATSDWTRLIGRMAAIIAVALVALVLFGGASAIKPRWLVPFFFMLPLWLCLKIDASGRPVEAGPRRFAIIGMLIMAVIPSILLVRPAFHRVTGHYEKLNVPYGPAIRSILATGPHRPSLIVADDLQMAGDIRLHAPGIPVMVPGYESFQPPHAFDAAHPLLMIWRDDGEAAPDLPDRLAAWLRKPPASTDVTPDIGDVSLPYHYGRAGDVYHFSYAWIYPAAE